MIEESDNDDATDLWDEVVGSQAVARFDALAGLTDTIPNAAGYWGETTTTALDQVRLLEHLVLPNSLLDDAARGYELGLMENVVPYERWGVSAGVPAGVTVALKNGWVPIVDGNWQINSIGYVDGQGRAYIIAVLTNENLTEGYGIATIEGIPRIVWSRLAPRSSRSRVPASEQVVRGGVGLTSEMPVEHLLEDGFARRGPQEERHRGAQLQRVCRTEHLRQRPAPRTSRGWSSTRQDADRGSGGRDRPWPLRATRWRSAGTSCCGRVR